MGLNGERRVLGTGSSGVGREDVRGSGWGAVCECFAPSQRLAHGRGVFFTAHAVPESEPASEASARRAMEVGS